MKKTFSFRSSAKATYAVLVSVVLVAACEKQTVSPAPATGSVVNSQNASNIIKKKPLPIPIESAYSKLQLPVLQSSQNTSNVAPKPIYFPRLDTAANGK